MYILLYPFSPEPTTNRISFPYQGHQLMTSNGQLSIFIPLDASVALSWWHSLCVESIFPWLPRHILFWFCCPLACYSFFNSLPLNHAVLRDLVLKLSSLLYLHSLCDLVQACDLKYHWQADNFQIYISNPYFSPEHQFLCTAISPHPKPAPSVVFSIPGNGSSTLPVTLVKNLRAILDPTPISHSTN